MLEYNSGYFEASEAEVYLVYGETGKRVLIAIYDTSSERFEPISGVYWTQEIVNKLQGE